MIVIHLRLVVSSAAVGLEVKRSPKVGQLQGLHSAKYRKMANFDHQGAETPELIYMKLGIID